jgi:hypothetical protein
MTSFVRPTEKPEPETSMRSVADGVWLLTYPLTLMGVEVGRNVTILRLDDSRLVIHSTGPVGPKDEAAIRQLGQPAWLVEAMLRHDTFAREGLATFPGIPYLAPEGFSEVISYPTLPLIPPPDEWSGQIQVLELRGVPSMRETVVLHVKSGTLIVADLAMNFPGDQTLWKELLLKVAVGKHHAPGISRAFKTMVKDEVALKESIAQMMRWKFDRLIVGHGMPLLSGAKARLHEALAEAELIE